MKSTTQRRMFSLLLALVMLFSLLPALGSTASAAGSGTTESDPKIVTTYAELSSALSSGTAYVKLGANINTKELNDGAGYTGSIRQTGTVQLDLDGYSVTFSAEPLRSRLLSASRAICRSRTAAAAASSTSTPIPIRPAASRC